MTQALAVGIVVLACGLVVVDYYRTGVFRAQPLEILLGIALALFGGFKLKRNGGPSGNGA